MSNPIKYSTGSETLELKKGNFYIGTGDVGKGPTSTTGYYNGISPPSGGYTIYLNKATGGPSIYTCSNDAQLISLTNSIAGTSYTTANECLVYYAGQTDKVCLNRDYEGIVTDGLIFNLDAGFTPSYPKNGTTWYDVSGSNNGTLTNGPTFSGDSIVFDGTNDLVQTQYLGITETNPRTFSMWFNPDINQNKNLLGYGKQSSLQMWDIILYQGAVGVHLYQTQAEANTPYTAGVWQNITFTYTHPTIKSYMNGVYKNSYTNSNINTVGNEYLNIGKGTYSPYFYFNGNIGTTLIYNRALSADEVLQNYNAQKGRFGL
jgi:hypothetical protein